MACTLNTHLIYHISDYLDVDNQKAYLLTDKEATNSLKFDAYYKKIHALKIQKWWRRFTSPIYVNGCYGYCISYDKLVENWDRYKGRQIQFAQCLQPYESINGNAGRKTSLGVIYTLTCCGDIIHQNNGRYITVGYPGFYNMKPYSIAKKLTTHLTDNLSSTQMTINTNFIYNKIIYVVTHIDNLF